MASLNNPAGRLFEYLTAFQQEADDSAPLKSIWADVFGLPMDDPEVYRRVGGVASLLDQVADAVRDDPGERPHWATVERYTQDWAGPLLPHAVGYGQSPSKAKRLVRSEAMLALSSLASHLSVVQPEGRDLPEDERVNFSTEIEQLIEKMRDDSALDEELRLLIVRRLRDIQLALDNYRITGPKGVRDACELLAAAIAWDNAEHDGETRFPHKVVDILNRVYTATTVSTTMYAAVEMGFSVAQLLS